MRQSGEHTHAPDPEKVSVERVRLGIKRAAKETNATTCKQYNCTKCCWCPRKRSCKVTANVNDALHTAYPPNPDDQDAVFHTPHRYTVSSTDDTVRQQRSGYNFDLWN